MTKKSAEREELERRLTKLLEKLGARRSVHHAVVAAVDINGRWRWSGALGEADPSGIPMRVDTPFLIASVTKLHIAAVVLLLTELGLIDLDGSIADQLPERLSTGLHVIDGVDSTHRITPRHLLGHLTGLPDSLAERPEGGKSLIERIVEEDRFWSLEDLVVHARENLRPHFAPSDPDASRPRIRYSDTNFQLLMLIAEHATGESMTSLHRKHLTEPLGLRNTWIPGEKPLEPAPAPSTIWFGSRPFAGRPLALRSFHDLYSTTDDLMRFGRALFTGEVFGSAATADTMWQHFNRFGFPRGMAALRAPSWPIEYGLGMMRFKLSRILAGGRRIPGLVGHTGSTGSWLWHCPSLDLLLCGTVDQTSAATVAFRPVPKALAGLDS